MRQFSQKTHPDHVAGNLVCGLPAGWPTHRVGVTLTDPASHKELPGKRPPRPLFRPAKRGAEGASKTVVTDYRIAGPGCATRNPVGWGAPQTPRAPLLLGATA